MEIIAISALAFSIIFFISIGIRQAKKNRRLSDIFPILSGRNATVDNTNEFSSSTVATTVSLATIIMAYFQLAGYFGLFLVWTTITTTIGMLIVIRLSPLLLERIKGYSHRPTLHEFLATEYTSKTILVVSSLCTSLGFLLIAALELIVGSLFLSQLIPSIPQYVTVIILSLTAVIYLTLGGYKTVIRSDVWQMKFIWLLIFSLIAYYVYDIFLNDSISASISNIPASVYNFESRPGLWMFLLGVTVMNIPTHLSNQAMFQRINATEKTETVFSGLRKSTQGIFWSWTLITLLACMAYMFVPQASAESLLPDLLRYMSNTTFGKIIFFIVVIGMYSALLSTASTNLIVIGHTISEDLIARFKQKSITERDKSKHEFNKSRWILFIAAIFSVFIVEFLQWIGFDIKDMVFSIYGGSLALFPPILFALLLPRQRIPTLSTYASLAIIFGFFVGWGVALYGKFIKNDSLIFLSPVFSIGVSALFMCLGLLQRRNTLTKTAF